MARCFWKAAPVLPADLAARLRKIALKQDTDFLDMPHTVTEGGGFVETLHTETGKPRSRSSNRPYTSRWATGYGHATHADTARLCCERYRQLAESHPDLALRYRAMVIAAAKQYLESDPPTSAVPGALAAAVDLMLDTGELTKDAAYLNKAESFADAGMRLFLDDGLPLPKAATGLEHYETITGGPAFMAVLLRLHEELTSR